MVMFAVMPPTKPVLKRLEETELGPNGNHYTCDICRFKDAKEVKAIWLIKIEAHPARTFCSTHIRDAMEDTTFWRNHGTI